MTTEPATPAPKIRRKRPTLYPAQLVVMTTDEQYAAVDQIAEDLDVSKSVVARALIEDGLKLKAYREGRLRTLPESTPL